jgi:UDP-N-acetylmuramyl pentapeptide phosphotransferase/UDP-N-acetylglucosamine-1-phosphate transferase
MILLGVVALTYQGITYTTKEKAIDIGPLQITAERTHTLPVLPILGGIAIVGGVVLFLASRRTT